MTSLFLVCALALPLHANSDYVVLKKYLESKEPDKTIVFIHPDERLLNPGADYTGLMTAVEGEQSLRVWAIRKRRTAA
jgi:hypothetical protein